MTVEKVGRFAGCADEVAMAELRALKRRAGVAEEAVRIKKELLDDEFVGVVLWCVSRVPTGQSLRAWCSVSSTARCVCWFFIYLLRL